MVTINSVSGSLAQDGSAVITGSDFGVKAVAAPMFYDDFEEGVDGDDVLDHTTKGWTTHINPGGMNTITYTSDYVRANSTLCAKCNMIQPSSSNGAQLQMPAQPDTLDKVFLAFWCRVEWGTPPTVQHQLKLWRIMDSETDAWGYRIIKDQLWTFTGGSKTAYYGVNVPTVQASIYHTHQTEAAWYRVEFQAEQSGPNEYNGSVEIWHSVPSGPMDKVADLSNYRTTEDAMRWRMVSFGEGFTSGIAEGATHWDQIYLDNSWARVVIGNASTYDACTIREHFVPTAWSDTSITATVKCGGLSGTVYLYVVDADGVWNANGFQIVLGAGPGDNTAPSITSSPVTTGTVRTPYEYTVEATDPESDPITFSLYVFPTGMEINPSTGFIQWVPNFTGTYNVVVRATDDGGLYDSQAYSITVGSLTLMPWDAAYEEEQEYIGLTPKELRDLKTDIRMRADLEHEVWDAGTGVHRDEFAAVPYFKVPGMTLLRIGDAGLDEVHLFTGVGPSELMSARRDSIYVPVGTNVFGFLHVQVTDVSAPPLLTLSLEDDVNRTYEYRQVDYDGFVIGDWGDPFNNWVAGERRWQAGPQIWGDPIWGRQILDWQSWTPPVGTLEYVRIAVKGYQTCENQPYSTLLTINNVTFITQQTVPLGRYPGEWIYSGIVDLSWFDWPVSVLTQGNSFMWSDMVCPLGLVGQPGPAYTADILAHGLEIQYYPAPSLVVRASFVNRENGVTFATSAPTVVFEDTWQWLPVSIPVDPQTGTVVSSVMLEKLSENTGTLHAKELILYAAG